jgi:hypothetical protein
MKMKSVRQAILLAAVLAGTAVFAVGPALAVPPPVCGGVASLMNHQIYKWNDVNHHEGENIVSIPAISPVNNNPGDVTKNGFIDLCKRFGLTGTTTELRQFNAQAGSITTYNCNQAVASGAWTPGQAVLIQPTADATGKIPGVECANEYAYFVWIDSTKHNGDNYYPTPVTLAGGGTPLTVTSGGARDLCTMLGLPGGTLVRQIFPAPPARVDDFRCGQVGPATDPLQLGAGVLIQPTGGGSGTPIIF